MEVTYRSVPCNVASGEYSSDRLAGAFERLFEEDRLGYESWSLAYDERRYLAQDRRVL
ncbi:hypothetical protein D3C73_1587190 [compost metagenome]